MTVDLLRSILRSLPPGPAALLRRTYRHWRVRPRLGGVRAGHLRRLEPICRNFGIRRGNPVDRHFIERFLDRHRNDVQGHVLEIGDSRYTRAYGGEHVTRSDVLHVVPGNPAATIVADLTHATAIADDSFDCIILTQTLHCIYDPRAALATVHRILKPGGTVLMTVPGISQSVRCDWGDDWYWSMTRMAVERLLREHFPIENVTVEHHGNVWLAVAFLHGLCAEELSSEELDAIDEEYQLLVTARAVKRASHHMIDSE